MKTYLRHIILLLLACSLPFMAQAAEIASETQDSPFIESSAISEFGGITLTINKKVVHIQNAEGLTLEVYNITGVRISTYSIDSADKQISLNVTKGCYILKVGKITRKITIS